MLDFCAKHGIVADIEMIRADEIDTASQREVVTHRDRRMVAELLTLVDGLAARQLGKLRRGQVVVDYT
ncbi:MAG: hypothetical protein JSR74_00235 [Proteobacteria bacterium]|nr:hypothetical protein [Pseudomonadota bacterium]